MKEPVHARRQFFRSMLRNVSLALLGGTGGVVVTKQHRLMHDGKCFNRGVCSGCDVFEDCGLPRALSAKLTVARTHDGK